MIGDQVGRAIVASPLMRQKIAWGWRVHSTMVSILASHPAALGSTPGVPEIFNVAKVNRQRCCLVQSTAEA